MDEILPGVHHWTAFRDTIGARVSSHWIEPAGILIDPMEPQDGAERFRQTDLPPQQIVLTSGLHDRHAERLAGELSIPIRAPREAADRIGDRLEFQPYHDGEEVAPGVRAVQIGVLCPDEYALHIDVAGGAVALADALQHYGDALGFFADEYLGDDPQAIKDGLREQLQALLQRDFEHLLFAHGSPLVNRGKAALRDFVGSPAGHEDFGQAL
ncbi:MAG TPA: hypothetical protein VFR97_13145 [Capillimicrobium sp.]|nr:hypothetical protein [Capillimicrobium sp.]